MNKSILIVIAIILLGSGFYIWKANSSKAFQKPQIDKIIQEKPRYEKPLIPADWKTYEGTTFKSDTVPTVQISFKYPPQWSFKQEYAHGTVDLGVFFLDSRNEAIMSFIYSDLSFKDWFYESQKDFLGELSPITIEDKKGYLFKNKYGYKESYYFPHGTGYFAINTYDKTDLNQIKQIISTLKITK